MDLFDKPKTATDLLIDLHKHRTGKMSKAEITARYKGQQWSSQELTLWARWQFREVVR